jgi:hypothetical protein
MLVRDLNDTEQALGDLAEAVGRIRPDELHLNLPTRPPAETWVHPPERRGLTRAAAILGSIAHVIRPVEGTFDLSSDQSVIDTIVGIITRHPMRQEEIENALAKWTPGQVGRALAELEASGRAQIVKRYGIRYWSAEPSFYPDEIRSKKISPELRNRKTARKASKCR